MIIIIVSTTTAFLIIIVVIRLCMRDTCPSSKTCLLSKELPPH